MVGGNVGHVEQEDGANDGGRQLELDAVDAGADPLSVLEARLARSRAARDAALDELRGVMSDADALDKYGIDTQQI